MSGIEGHNLPAFAAAAVRLELAWYEAVDPGAKGVLDGWSWTDYLRFDLRAMLDCEGVAILPGWVDSPGAWLEVSVARSLDMPVKSVQEWLDAAAIGLGIV